MAIEPTNDIIPPEDSENLIPSKPSSLRTPESMSASPAADGSDGDAEIPVPVAMEPAEIDERAKAVEALNRSEELP
jgi:hypothetical protein